MKVSFSSLSLKVRWDPIISRSMKKEPLDYEVHSTLQHSAISEWRKCSKNSLPCSPARSAEHQGCIILLGSNKAHSSTAPIVHEVQAISYWFQIVILRLNRYSSYIQIESEEKSWFIWCCVCQQESVFVFLGRSIRFRADFFDNRIGGE